MKLRAARAAAGAMGGRKRVRARCVRMPKASMQSVHLSIYSFPLFLPLFRKFYYRSTSTGKKPRHMPFRKRGTQHGQRGLGVPAECRRSLSSLCSVGAASSADT